MGRFLLFAQHRHQKNQLYKLALRRQEKYRQHHHEHEMFHDENLYHYVDTEYRLIGVRIYRELGVHLFLLQLLNCHSPPPTQYHKYNLRWQQ